MFVDWEYGAIGQPMFDLAGIVRQNRFSKVQVDNLHSAYFGVSAEKFRSRLRIYSGLYDLLSALWCQAIGAAGVGAAGMQDH
jgi:thiamine kinase-like enzyme